MQRDRNLIGELLGKLEALPMRPGAIVHIALPADEIAVGGYDDAQIEYHLRLIRDAGFIDDGDVRPMQGIGFRRLTNAGHDFLEDFLREKQTRDTGRHSESPASEPLTEAALAEIRATVADIKAQLPTMTISNTAKAEIDADLDQIAVETGRPTPRRPVVKIFLESLRDNLAKAAGAGAAAALVTAVGGLLARYFGLL